MKSNQRTKLSRKARFLSQFSSDVLPHIHEFCRYLSESNADVVMLMARKAACFVDCLEELGLLSLSGFVTTNRVLDMDTSWLRGKNVLIVDEALISGTTLYETRKQILASGAKSVDFRLLCINKRTHSKALVKYNKPCLRLSELETTSLCLEIVEAISLMPLPYAVDFPHLRNLRVPLMDVHELTNMQNWEVFDISSSLQEQHEVLVLTMIPTKPILDGLHEDLGWKIEEGSHIFKIRLYGQIVDRKRKTYLFRVMPLAVFDPFSEKQLNQIWENILNLYPNHEAAKYFSTPKSKIRLLQYVVSARLGRFFVNGLRQNIEARLYPRHDQRMLGYLFPPSTSSFVIELCRSENRLFDKRLKVTSEDLPVNKGAVQLDDEQNPWRLQVALTKPFTEFYEHKEKKARELALEFGAAALEMPEHQEIMDRLNTGISLPELRAVIRNKGAQPESATAISLFIDFAIDRGVIVPIIAEKNRIFYRAYRHGEDIEFTESEARLFCIALKNFLDASLLSDVPHLVTEKLFVLLIKIGLHRGILTRWNGVLGSTGTVGVRYYLQGALVQQNSRTLYEYNPEKNLTAILLDAGYLGERRVEKSKKEKENAEQSSHMRTRYFVNIIPDAPVKKTYEYDAEIIGGLLAELLYPANPETKHARLTQRELILISSCLNPGELAAALAGEIDVFVCMWSRIKNILKTALEKNDAAQLAALAKDLREPQLRFFEAINSGSWKFVSYMNGMPRNILKRIEKGLSGSVFRPTWKSFWPTTPQAGSYPEDLKALGIREGIWCHRANILIRTAEASIIRKIEAPDSDPKRVEQLDKIRSEIQSYIAELEIFEPKQAKTIRSEFRRIRDLASKNKKLDFNDELLRFVFRECSKLIAESHLILDIVNAKVEPFGKPLKNDHFPHVLYISVKSYGRDKALREKLDKLIADFRLRAKDQSKKSTRMEQVPFGQREPKQGTWVCSRGNFSRSWLLRLASEIFETFGNYSEVKLVLFANLEEDWGLLLNTKSTKFHGRLFWDFSSEVLNHSFAKERGSSFCIAVQEGGMLEEGVKADVQKTIAGLNRNKETTIQVNQPYFLNLALKRYEYAQSAPSMNSKNADIGIITIIPKETRAVVNYLKQQPGYGSYEGSRYSSIFYEGTLPLANGKSYRIACTQAIKQANRSVIKAYERLVGEYSPSVIVLLGIAGSIDPKLNLGDVVLADQIFYYDERAETEGGTKWKSQGYQLPVRLKPYLNDFLMTHDDKPIHPGNLLSPEFLVRSGPIGSGEAVVKNGLSHIREHLCGVNDKMLALETEAGGVALAFYEDELSRDDRPVGYLVLRGISDHADHEKDDLWQDIASQNAVTVLVKLLHSISTIKDSQILLKQQK